MRALHPAVVILTLALAAGCVHDGLHLHRETVTLTVVDKSGAPIPAANVVAGFFGTGEGGSGNTGSNGCFKVTGKPVSSLHCWVTKSGFYGTNGELWGGPSERRPRPPTNEYVVVLKNIVEPVPMVAHEVNKTVPVLDQKVGFDLREGDWVAPFGKGLKADMEVTAHYVTPDESVFEKRLTITFPNPGDGIMDGRTPAGSAAGLNSDLPVSQLAPIEGYRSETVQLQQRTATSDLVNTARTLDGHVFRVRSVKDQTGKLVRANYGWIVWGFEMGGREPVWNFHYYFNPNPESRSLEPADLPRTREYK